MLGCAFVAALSLLFPPQGTGKKPASVSTMPTKVYLKSGHSFQGQVISEDDTTLKLSVSYGHVILRKDEIKDILRGDGIKVVNNSPSSDAASLEEKKAKTPIGFQLPPSLTAEEKAAIKAAPPAAAEAAPTKQASSNVVQGFLGHFLWFLPESDDGKFLCGGLFFLAFLLLFFLASKMAGIEDLSFGKALGFCVPFCLALALQVHYDAHSIGTVLLYAGLDLAIWFGLVAMVLREPLFRGAGMLALFVFAGLLGILASQLSFVILRQDLT